MFLLFVGFATIILSAAALVAFAMAWFEIFGYTAPWGGPFDLFRKIHPMVVGIILVLTAYALLKICRWRYHITDDMDADKPWWRSMPP